MKKWLLGGVILLAFLLRIIGLQNYPAGFNADEVNQGYTAYSILITGRDEWGKFLPIAPRSYGDYRAPLYTYLVIPSIAIFGLSEFAVRLPNAIFGTLAVLITYYFVLELLKDKKIALLSSLLLAISPWHVMLSRGAFEPNLPVFLIPFGWLAFEKAKKQKWWIIISGLVFGLSLFAYYSARFLVPILVIVLLWKEYRNSKKINLSFLAVFLFFLITALFTSFFGAAARSSDVVIFNPTGGWGAVADKRYEAVLLGLPTDIARVFSNKLTYTLELFISNYLSYFSAQFLFTQGAGEATYGMFPGRGVLYLIELLFLAGFIWALVSKKIGKFGILLFWLLIASIPAALAKGPGYAANRAAVMMPVIQIFSAIGAVFLYQKLKPKKYVIALVLGCLVLSFVFFVEDYLFHAPGVNAEQMSYGWRETMEYVEKIETRYKTIVISRHFSEPQMFVAFYTKADPLKVQQESQSWLRYEKEGLKFVDQLGFYKFGKYEFRDIVWQSDSSSLDTLFVGRPEDFPENVNKKIIRYPAGKDAFWIVDPAEQLFACKI